MKENKLSAKSVNGLHEKICAKLNAFRGNSQFSDVTLVTSDGETFPAHKIILSAQSPVLAAMFSNKKFIENRDNQVKFENINKEMMESFLDFIYGGDVTLVEKYAVELFEVAHQVSSF